ncbi:MAG: ERF family protein [Proteocatella sp.]
MKNLAKKLLNVMDACSHVLKNGENSFHHYKYATSADVLEKVNAALVENGLCSIAVPEILNVVEVTNLKGNIERLATVKIDILLIDKDSGETVTLTGIGSGQDGGDKAVMKAQTAAIKYAYMLSLAISTGDDPEADGKTDESGGILSQINHGENSEVRKISLGQVRSGTLCEECENVITDKVARYSMGKYGKMLCMGCQKHAGRSA